MPLYIAIPTYDRVSIFNRKTYSKIIKPYKLEKYTTLFIQSDKDAKEYKEAFPELKQVRSPKGYLNTLNKISNYYPKGAKIIKMDDDLSAILHLVDGNLRKVGDAYGLFNKTFGIMKNVGASLGGYYPTPNPKFMAGRKPITTDLRFIQGALYCFVNRGIKFGSIPQGKSDYSFTIENYKRDGKVVRLNDYSFRYSYSSDDIATKSDTDKFMSKYSKYVSKVIVHKNGTTSFLLKKNPNKKSNEDTNE